MLNQTVNLPINVKLLPFFLISFQKIVENCSFDQDDNEEDELCSHVSLTEDLDKSVTIVSQIPADTKVKEEKKKLHDAIMKERMERIKRKSEAIAIVEEDHKFFQMLTEKAEVVLNAAKKHH